MRGCAEVGNPDVCLLQHYLLNSKITSLGVGVFCVESCFWDVMRFIRDLEWRLVASLCEHMHGERRVAQRNEDLVEGRSPRKGGFMAEVM